MAARAILLVAVAIFSFAVIAHPDDTSTLPSQKASVVVPLLEKIKGGDSPGKIDDILGRGLIPSGPSGAGQTPLRCVLDDGSIVDVQVWSIPGHGDGIISISLKRPGKATEQIYPPSK